MSHIGYPSYKDTGTSWLGAIPNHWDIKPLWSMFKRQKRTGHQRERLLSVYRDYGVIPKDSRDDNANKASEDLSTYQLVKPGDLAINKMKAWQGSVAISTIQGIVSPAYFIFTPTHHALPKYLHYLFRCTRYIAGYLAISKGVRVGQWDMDPDYHSRMPVVIPPRKEQEEIADFLDRETSRIDSLIEKKTRFIELLKEKRQAVITHAVTKGLDPSAPMKDSGVEWLGQVPKHWSVTSLKRIVSTPITDGPHETPVFHDSGIPFVSAEAVSSGDIDFTKIRGYITPEEHLRFSRKYRPQKDDIYMVKSGATTGVTAMVVDDTEFNIWSPLAAIRCGTIAHPPYILAYMRSRNFLDGVALNWSYGTQQNIGMGVLENLSVTLPPIEEQIRISSHLIAQSNRINTLIKKTEQSLGLLKEHRSALITGAVTGKIDVRKSR